MAKNTIVIKGYLNIRDEKVATAVAITPGKLIERTSGDLVQVHALAGGPVNPLFALEDAFQGKKITDDYAISVPIIIWKPIPGEQVYAHVSGTDAVIGDFMESAGDGTLRPLNPVQSSAGVPEYAGNIVAVALEAVSTGNSFIVEIV